MNRNLATYAPVPKATPAGYTPHYIRNPLVGAGIGAGIGLAGESAYNYVRGLMQPGATP